MQRSVGNPIIACVDLLSLIIGGYGFDRTILKIPLPPHLADAGPWQFLTNLGLVFSLIVFSIGFLSHVTKWEKLFKVKNQLHPLCLVLEIIITIVYWPLRLFFIELLILDKSAYPIPIYADLSVHLMPCISLLIDYFVFMPRWTMKARTAMLICLTFTILYWFLLEYLIDLESGGTYPYAFLNVPHHGLRVLIFAVICLTGFSQFLIMSKLYNVFINVPVDTSIEEVTKKEI